MNLKFYNIFCNLRFSVTSVLVLLFSVSNSFSQGLINNGAVITLNAVASSAAPFIIVDGGVNGIFTNKTDGASEGEISVLNTGGTMIVEGDWLNTANNTVFNGDGSTVFLNGNNVQRIGPTSGTGGNETGFYNLTLGGTDIKTLDVNTEVGGVAGTGVLDLTDMLLELNQNTLSITNPSSGTSATGAIRFNTGAIYSESESSIVSWNMQTSTGNHIYPFINSLAGGTFIPFELNITAAGTESVVGAGTIDMSTYYSAANAVTPSMVSNMLPGEDHAADRFWVMGVSGYVADSEPVSNADFGYDDSAAELGSITETDLLLQNWSTNWDPPVGSLDDIGNVASVTGILPKTGAWVLGYGPDPLPISLISFQAACQNESVKIQWSTASERNNNFFNVEKRLADNTYESIATIPASGNSNTLRNYHIFDYNCKENACYYRLKQTDYDGRFTYSDLIAINCDDADEFEIISAVAEAGTENLKLIIKANEEEAFNYSLYNSVGQEVAKNKSSVNKGINALNLQINELSQGVYFLVINSEKRVLSKKIPLNY